MFLSQTISLSIYLLVYYLAHLCGINHLSLYVSLTMFIFGLVVGFVGTEITGTLLIMRTSTSITCSSGMFLQPRWPSS